MDINTLAKSIVEQAVGDKTVKSEPSPKAVARGEARARALVPERRKEIAKKAAETRWGTPRKRTD
jgi:hypothetical protein